MLLAKRPRLCLDRKSNAGGRPDEMIDVPTTRPAHTVPHHPPAAGQPLQGTPDRSLRVGTQTPAIGDALRTARPPKQAGSEQEEREDHERISPDPRSAQADEEDQRPGEQISVASDSMSILLTTRVGHAWREHTAASLELSARQLSCCKVVTVSAHGAPAAGVAAPPGTDAKRNTVTPRLRVILTINVLRQGVQRTVRVTNRILPQSPFATARTRTAPFRPDRQHRRVSPAWLVTQVEREAAERCPRGWPSAAGFHQFGPCLRRGSGRRLCP